MDGSIPPSSVLSSASSSSSNPFRPRRSDDWNEYRPIIEALYRDNQLKLRDVKRIMEREHHFVASEKQYKDRLAAWHIRKNIKAKEVHVMIRKQQKRAARGKQTAFRVGGQEVDSKRIARFVRRYGTNWDNNKSRDSARQPSPEPDTPSDMSCYTPEPNETAPTLSPLPETQTLLHHDDKLSDPLPDPESDLVTAVPLSSPSMASNTTTTSTTTTATALEEAAQDEDPWRALTSFQNRLLALDHSLERSLSGFISPHEHTQQQQNHHHHHHHHDEFAAHKFH